MEVPVSVIARKFVHSWQPWSGLPDQHSMSCSFADLLLAERWTSRLLLSAHSCLCQGLNNLAAQMVVALRTANFCSA